MPLDVALVALERRRHRRFAVGDGLYAGWDIRRMALEPRFFQESADDE